MSSRSLLLAVSFVAFMGLSGCASAPATQANPDDAVSVSDPFEPVNRVVFDVNDFLDRLLMRPLAELYRIMVPPPVRERVASVLDTMGEPVVMANNLLQGDVTKAGTTLGRFFVNASIGLGGMFDVASKYGLEKQTGDFGQTLHVWGLSSGPYLVLPLFGPSNLRDALGSGVDTVMSPWRYVVAFGDTAIEDSFMIADLSASGLSRREANIEAVDSLREGALDFYAQMRSVHRQYRAKKLGVSLANEAPVFEEDCGCSPSPLGK